MAYLTFISDEDYLENVATLFLDYKKAASEIDLEKFYENKIDVVKLTTDKLFFNKTDEEILANEIQRQVDKSVNNAIGDFHENMCGSIAGFTKGNHSGWDVRALDNTLFADIKNKFNTMNSKTTEELYQVLQRIADDNEQARCYWVAILAKKSYDEHWEATFDASKGRARYYNHPRVWKISGDRFYAKLSGVEDALFQIYDTLPKVINDYLNSLTTEEKHINYQVITQLHAALRLRQNGNEEGLINRMAKDNYPYYRGFLSL